MSFAKTEAQESTGRASRFSQAARMCLREPLLDPGLSSQDADSQGTGSSDLSRSW